MDVSFLPLVVTPDGRDLVRRPPRSPRRRPAETEPPEQERFGDGLANSLLRSRARERELENARAAEAAEGKKRGGLGGFGAKEGDSAPC